MKLEPITSEMASHAGFDPERQVLRVVYKNTGAHYEHGNVTPEMYAAFQGAFSKGKWLQANLRDKSKHPFQKVPPL